ncbi:MAG: EamA family transporter [Deltaproteobacteria bacterium]|nr:EamA family transporter [Deltaproteobacteria bacterium]MBI4223679.1 EamA family transporter [Deltaproteobacteria bacterium]
MLKTMIVLGLAMLCAGVGNIFMRQGLQKIGVGPSRNIFKMLVFFRRAVANPLVLLGVLISIGYFALWLAVLSWADVSWALPMNAVEYVFVALAAVVFLKERVGRYRWLGIGLILLGMIFMMESWHG